jgi:hypothetical protein
MVVVYLLVSLPFHSVCVDVGAPGAVLVVDSPSHNEIVANRRRQDDALSTNLHHMEILQ